MAETFDYTRVSAGTNDGVKVAGDTITQGSDQILVPAGYLVYGPADGPYIRVEAAVGLPVTVVAALPAGTSAIGKLAANDGVDIGDVTINNASLAATQSGAWSITDVSGTISLPTGAATAAKQPALGTAGTASADVITVQGIASMTALKVDGSAVTQPVSGTVSAGQSGTWNIGTVTAVTAISNALPAGSNAIGKLAVNDGVDIGDVTINNASGASAVNIQDGGNSITVDGTVAVSGTVTVAAHAVTNAGTFAVQAASTQSGTWNVGVQPITSGGLTPHKTVSAASTNATSVKGSAGQLYEIFCSNVNAAVRYLKLYDKATAPTVGTDVPVWTLAIPGGTAGAGFAKTIPMGLAFSLGIAFALTTEATDAGTTGVSANEHVVNLGYK